MRKISLVIALVCLSVFGCSNQQSSDAVFYKVEISVDSLETSAKAFTKNLQVGPKALRVPINIQWISKLDKDGCLKISAIKLTRMGGDEHLFINSASHQAIPGCDLVSDNGPRIQSVGVKVYSESINQLRQVTHQDFLTIKSDGQLEL
jgi:hypothetical protein